MENRLPDFSSLDLNGKRVLVRVDLNVPMEHGKVRDATRIERHLSTLRALADKGAKVVVISHLGRPKGKYDPALSLAALVDPLAEMLGDIPVKFAPDSVGPEAEAAIAQLNEGEVILLENLRFHPEEEANESNFSQGLAKLADYYVNDAFSCSHRAHASTVGVTQFLPSYAGQLMQKELSTLVDLFSTAEKPLGAVVGGAKISTKLRLLEQLITSVDCLVIGGAMAHTFLVAKGLNVGKSLYEQDLVDTAKKVLTKAKESNCDIYLPLDVAVTEEFSAGSPNHIVPVEMIPADAMALDVGSKTIIEVSKALSTCKTVLWNGPMGAFEMAPYDAGTVMLARTVAAYTRAGEMHSVAGGGDTAAALAHAGLTDEFSYVSTAGGAFLEWLEGDTLPGISALEGSSKAA